MSAFEDAVRRYFGVSEDDCPNADVFCHIDGGREVQIGDMTWDTEPYDITIGVYIRRPRKPTESRRETFATLPDVWKALS